MFQNKEIQKLKEDIIGLKQLLEQETLRADKATNLNEDLYPAITELHIKKGWYGDGVSSFKVEIEVEAEDLHKLINVLTVRTLSKRKYLHIIEEYKKLKKE